MEKQEVIIAIINITAFYFLWFFLYRNYFVDSFKHELFVLRDELFKYAAEGNISFDDPAFIDRWKELNSMIQNTGNTYPILFAGMLHSRKNKKSVEELIRKREANLERLSEAQKEFLRKNNREQLKLFVQYVFKSSFVVMFVSVSLALLGLVKLLFLRFSNPITALKREALTKAEPIYNGYFETALHSA